MRWLPPIAVGKSRVRLPLLAGAARALEASLLESDAEQRDEGLLQLAQHDSLLALWLALEGRAGLDATSPSAWSSLLWGRLLPQLAQAPADSPAAEVDQSDANPRDRRIARQCAARMTAAELAVDALHALSPSGAVDDSLETAVRVATLLHLPLRWCDVLAEVPRDALRPFHPLLGQPERVRQIVDDASAAQSGKPPDGYGWKQADIQRRRQLLCDRLLEDNGAADRLQPLTALVLRQRVLEQQFDAALHGAKMQSLYQLAYGASHEINNPLSNISVHAQALLGSEEDPERRRRLAAMNRQAFRAHEMITDLMVFARPPGLQRSDTNLNALIATVIGEMAEEAGAAATSLEHVGDTRPLVARVDREQLAIGLRALCRNALEAIGSAGRVEIEARPYSSDSEQGHRITVTDNGPGLSPDAARHLFDPFFSGREAGRGLGFGLSKCWRIVTAHGGTVEVDTQPGRGSSFALRLPVETDASAGRPPRGT